ncbi:MAG: TIGR04282 family arsenosugar biosynthesis glycosyltransferase [Planctomycetota bacterium]
MATQIGVFAKHWTPGRVKTRLAKGIGEAAAAGVARAFLETLVVRLHSLADEAVIGFAPAGAAEAFRVLAPDWRLEAQCDGDLGCRMQAYFAEAFSRGHQRVLLLGADSPDVPRGLVRDALEALDKHRLVLGPTEDGGYYLVGARGEPPPIFASMPWSTADLWEATRSRLADAGWTEGVDWRPLPTWYDVDTVTDLERLRASVAASEDAALADLRATLDRLAPAGAAGGAGR